MEYSKFKRMLLIMNPKAGTMQANKQLTEILSIFTNAGFMTTVMMTMNAGDGRIFAENYTDNVDTVVCIGGDGTLNEVIDGLLNSGNDCIIGYIPGGSTNDFATSLGIPKNIIRAAECIAAGNPISLDVGEFNGRRFSYVASFGAFTSTSYAVPQNFKNILGHNAYVLQGFRDILNIKPIMARIVADQDTENERIYEGRFIFGGVCNSTSVGGLISLKSFDVEMNDGLMEVFLIRTPENLIELNSIVRTLLDGSLDSEQIKLFSAKEVHIHLDKDVPWTLDGEYEKGDSDIEVKTLHNAIRLITNEKDTN